MGIRVIAERCTGCTLCVSACPFDAITVAEGLARIDTAGCNLCGACVDACEKHKAIELIRRKTRAVDKNEHRGVWVFAEEKGGTIANVTLELLGEGKKLAHQLGEPLCAILLGDGVEQCAPDLIYFGADYVHVAQSPQLRVFLEDSYTDVMAGLIRERKPSIVLLGATAIGRSLAPRVAARLATGLTADCTGLAIEPTTRDLVQIRPAFGGNLMATILCPNHRPQMATVRPKVFRMAQGDESRVGQVIKYDFTQQTLTQRAEVLEAIEDVAEADTLAQADIIVSAGLGLGDARNVRLIEDLARALGGAVAGSRAAVDAGWIPYTHQVGQTGKTVRPRLYIACGIRGAIQHLVGMQSAETIVAVNKDPKAPIFSVADYGIVGDVLEVVPILTSQIQNARSDEQSPLVISDRQEDVLIALSGP